MRGVGHARACACSFSLRRALTWDSPSFHLLPTDNLCQPSESVGSVGSSLWKSSVYTYVRGSGEELVVTLHRGVSVVW